MNAKMRIGLAGVILATGATMAVAGTPEINGQRFDRQLEAWAKERVAQKMGDLRGGYGLVPDIDFVTQRDIQREPRPLGQELDRDTDNLLYRAFVEGSEAPAGAGQATRSGTVFDGQALVLRRSHFSGAVAD